MKKVASIIIAVYFLIGGLTPKMDFQQLFHLFCAMEHYSVHQAEAQAAGTTFTLTDFLMDHYLDPDNHEHNKDSNEEHPCTHSHSHTVDFAEIDLLLPMNQLAEEEGLLQIFSAIFICYSADFTSGLDEPPSYS